MELAIFLFLVTAALFVYQIVAVWMRCYGYSLRSEMRLWIMIMCVVYCLCKYLSKLTHLNI